MADAITPATTTMPVRLVPTSRRRDLSGLWGYLLIAPPVAIMLLLIFYPAVLAVIDTIFVADATTGQVGPSLQHYTSFFQDRILVTNLWFTLWITLATVALLFVIGYPLALYLRFSKSRL